MVTQHGWIAAVVIGAIAGWLAGLVVKGRGFGLIIDIMVGVAGAVFGGWLAGVLHISVGAGLVGALLTAFAGAVVLLLALRAL